MSTFYLILFSTLCVSMISLSGVLVLFFKENILRKIILFLVAFSAGALMGGALFHLLPEAIEIMDNSFMVYVWIMIGFSTFFFLEQFIHWHHCHKLPSEHKEPFTYLVLISDSVHNFIDGTVIASAFIVDIKVGIATWIAVMLHEFPQELGDFGVLIHGGWSKIKALIFNFTSSFTVIIGAMFVYFTSSSLSLVFLLPFASGSFIYIAASDLIPEIKLHPDKKNSIFYFLFFVLGISFTLIIKLIDF
ncbi:MAG: ZIP family metal transporter [Patescibacteria group bacterium]|nr:ZIP family metal transporter [Patescibacteria group bacterium]MDD4303996.1 ZIP family metal transporter [Patescibacteria group bacterium]MDD4695015.1 ZIP family metal transporter [Patescibacteria group bacterium]